MTIDFSKTLSILSSMYLCKPAKEALESWRILLSGDVPEILLDLKDAVNGIDLNSEQELKDLLWEYTRLFIGPYKLPCPPWESVYTSTKRLMMQDAYDEVRNLYAETGLTISSPDIMFDHIGAELNFLAVLLQRMNNEHEKRLYYRDVAKMFLDRHLMNWVPQFARDMENASDSLLYRTLPKVTGHVLYMITEGAFS